MSYLHIDKALLKKMADEKNDEPIFILNLLKFREKAADGFGVDGMTGKEAFLQYSQKFYELAAKEEKLGGEAIWMGQPDHALIGKDEEWDLFVLAKYASARELGKFMGSEAYDEIALIRAAGLVDSRLLETTQLLDPGKILAGD